MGHQALTGFDPDECSLNNGVLLYDLDQWRRNNFTKSLLEWTELNSRDG
jgi:lipopolysaccharide biosynthesis glycosyltransferase